MAVQQATGKVPAASYIGNVVWQRGVRKPSTIQVHHLGPATYPHTTCMGLHVTASPYLGLRGHAVYTTTAAITCQRCALALRQPQTPNGRVAAKAASAVNGMPGKGAAPARKGSPNGTAAGVARKAAAAARKPGPVTVTTSA